MTEQECMTAARIMRDAGEFELAEKLELQSEHARKDAAQYRHLARERAWDDYGIPDDGD